MCSIMFIKLNAQAAAWIGVDRIRQIKAQNAYFYYLCFLSVCPHLLLFDGTTASTNQYSVSDARKTGRLKASWHVFTLTQLRAGPSHSHLPEELAGC